MSRPDNLRNAVWGHRGAPADAPENTLAGFARAKSLGLIGYELDVHLSRDGVPVIMHDETVDRTTNGTGEIASMTRDELAQLDAGNGEHVPTLTEVLDLVDGSMKIDIEIKAPEAGDAVLKVMQERSDAWLISSFDWDCLRHVRKQSDDAELWVLTPGATDDALDAFRELGASALAIWDRGIDEDIARMLNEQRIPWWVWTVNSVDRCDQLLEWGALGVCTDNPALLLNGE